VAAADFSLIFCHLLCRLLFFSYTPSPYLGAYSVSKTALISLTKVMAIELAARKIRVNCVAPVRENETERYTERRNYRTQPVSPFFSVSSLQGVIKTKFSEALWKEESTAETSLKDIPLARFGEPDEVGALGCFLCSDDASYITGETVVVAGGVQSRL
jgi:dehydrogenase/reductase SDR family protein 4